MSRVIRESPRRAVAAVLAVIALVATGWLAGANAAGSTTRRTKHIPTVVSTATETVTETATQPTEQARPFGTPRGKQSRRS